MSGERDTPAPGKGKAARGVRLARRSLLGGALALAADRAAPQGFAGLGGGGEGFARPDPALRLHFPRDHGAHPDFRIEWWYLTANLTDAEGRDWGAQWTLFRGALDPGNPQAQAWMGHAALTTPEAHLATERFARPRQAGVDTPGARGSFAAWIDEWQLAGAPEDALSMSAGGPDFAFALGLQAHGPLVLHGAHGYSLKSAAGQASWYYSQPFLRATGRVETASGSALVSGIAWLDHEWSSEPLDPDQAGWDWFSLSFADGAKLMGFRLRGREDYTSATWIAADGESTTIAPGQLRVEPLATAEAGGHRVPTLWRLRLAAPPLDIEVRALHDDCWMPLLFAYWEGPVRVSGSRTGIGYLEMTGYD